MYKEILKLINKQEFQIGFINGMLYSLLLMELTKKIRFINN